MDVESGIHRHGIRNPQRGMRNPRLSWITLHGAIDVNLIVNVNLIYSGHALSCTALSSASSQACHLNKGNKYFK